MQTNQIYLDMYDNSKMLPYLLQIQHCSYCICRVQLQPEKRENGIQLSVDVVYITNHPSAITPSITKKVL